jgi:hypothetical protein
MMSYQVTGETGGERDLQYLRAAAAACYASYQATHYQQAAGRVAN